MDQCGGILNKGMVGERLGRELEIPWGQIWPHHFVICFVILYVIQPLYRSQFSHLSVQFNRSVVSNSLRPRGLQHTVHRLTYKRG